MFDFFDYLNMLYGVLPKREIYDDAKGNIIDIYHSLKMEIAKLREKNEALKQKNEQLNIKLAQSEKECAKWRANFNAKNDQFLDLKKYFRASGSEIDIKLQNQKNEIKNLSEALKKAKLGLGSARSQLAINQSVHNELEAANKSNNELNRKRIENKVAWYSEMRKNKLLNAEIEKLKAKIRVLEGEPVRIEDLKPVEISVRLKTNEVGAVDMFSFSEIDETAFSLDDFVDKQEQEQEQKKFIEVDCKDCTEGLNCWRCGNSGKYKIPVDCANCEGTGEQKIPNAPCVMGNKHFYTRSMCLRCNGTGKSQQFLNLQIDKILSSICAIDAFAGFKIADILDCRKEALFNTARSNIREHIWGAEAITVTHCALRAIENLEYVLSKYGLKLKE